MLVPRLTLTSGIILKSICPPTAIDGDLSDTLNCIEDDSRARTFRNQTIEESLDDSDRQLRLCDTYCTALLRNEQQVLQAALEYIQWM